MKNIKKLSTSYTTNSDCSFLDIRVVSAQIDTAQVLEGWREKYKSADDAIKLECDPSRIIQSACVAIVLSSIAINPLSDIPSEAFINISSLCFVLILPLNTSDNI